MANMTSGVTVQVNTLVVDSDPAVFAHIQTALRAESNRDYAVSSAASLADGVTQIGRVKPDAVILDARLPASGGLADSMAFCRQVRAGVSTAQTAILFLIADGSAEDVARALDAGGDDTLRKPFSGRELSARLRALLRRSGAVRQATTALVLEADGQTITLGARQITLTRTEYELLAMLSEHSGTHLSASLLLEKVWRYPPNTGDTALVRNHVRNLRVKLEDDPERPRIVVSHHGRGYTLSPDVIARAEAPLAATN